MNKILFLGLDLAHWGLIVGTPMVSGLVDYFLNANAPLSLATVSHALLASLLVGLTVFKAQADKQLAAADHAAQMASAQAAK